MKRVRARLEWLIEHPGWSVWPICQTLNVPNIALWGPTIGWKFHFGPSNQLIRHILDWKRWNKVGTPMKTSKQTSLEDFPDPDCPKYGPTEAKKEPKLVFKSLLAKQIGPGGLFQIGRGGTRLEIHWRHPGKPVWAICWPWMSQMWHYRYQKGAKNNCNPLIRKFPKMYHI